MHNIKIAKELKSNVQVDIESFERAGLRLKSVNVRPHELNGDSDLTFVCEVESLDGGSISKSANVKLNLYDQDGDLYSVCSSMIGSTWFTGYDAFETMVHLGGSALQIIKSARAYIGS